HLFRTSTLLHVEGMTTGHRRWNQTSPMDVNALDGNAEPSPTNGGAISHPPLHLQGALVRVPANSNTRQGALLFSSMVFGCMPASNPQVRAAAYPLMGVPSGGNA